MQETHDFLVKMEHFQYRLQFLEDLSGGKTPNVKLTKGAKLSEFYASFNKNSEQALDRFAKVHAIVRAFAKRTNGLFPHLGRGVVGE